MNETVQKGAHLDQAFKDAVIALAFQDWEDYLRAYLNLGGSLHHAAAPLGGTLLHEAASYQSAAALNWLLDRGADVNMQNQEGQTALHLVVDHALGMAEEFGWDVDWEAVQVLLARGASVFVRDNQGRLPADVARGYGREALREYLELLDLYPQP